MMKFIKEKILSSHTDTNGVTHTRATSNNINIAFILAILIGIVGISSVYASFTGGTTQLQVCQESYMKATNEIVQYNTQNPKYKLQLPEYDCNITVNSSSGTHSTGITVPPPNNLRKRFGLEDCRFINEVHKIKDMKWIGYDIACEKGKSFDVKSPGEYTIEKIGNGANMGAYIILKKSSEVGDEQTRIVLGHTKTSRSIGDKLGAGDIVGQTQSMDDIKSGIAGETTGVHVHIELWEGYHNVSREFALGEEYTSLDQTKLLTHRGWNFGQPKIYKEKYYFTTYDLGDVNQNDSSPCIGASGKDLCKLEASGVRTMALTVDIRNKLGIKFGDKVRLEGDKNCSGDFQVEDEMNKRFREGCITRPGTNYCIKGDIPSKGDGACSITKL